MLRAIEENMKPTDQIRTLLDEIDAKSTTPDDKAFAENFNSLELPELICAVVDFLQP